LKDKLCYSGVKVISLLIVDEIKVMGDAIASSLSGRDDMEVKAVVTSIDEARKHLSNCDLIMISETIPEDDFYELLQIAKEHIPRIQVLSMGLPDVSSERSDHLKAGASGYWSKGESPADLILDVMENHLENSPGPKSLAVLRANIQRMGELATAMDHAARQSRSISNSLHAQIDEFRQEQRFSRSRGVSLDVLTSRQKEVLELVSQGLSNAEIAQELNIMVGTVKNHIHHILLKLGVDSRLEATMIFRTQRKR
jgi:DNA-binding NarL/FixJ family response regulator